MKSKGRVPMKRKMARKARAKKPMPAPQATLPPMGGMGMAPRPPAGPPMMGFQKGGAVAPLGEGGRFKALSSKLAKKGASSPDALAAWIGRKKYGKAGMAKLSAQGRKEG